MFLARNPESDSDAFRMLVGLLLLPGLTDVVCNAPSVWFADIGKGLRRLPNFALSEQAVAVLARFLVDLGERHLDIATPIADVSLDCERLRSDPDLGESFSQLLRADVQSIRVHAVLSSAVSSNTLLAMRIHRKSRRSLSDLAASAGWDSRQTVQLREIANNRQNFLVTGPAGAGKTTLLRAMVMERQELRTVVIEDSSELLPCGAATVGLAVRVANLDGAGFIGLPELARQALRMRPDRLVVGEIRGTEVMGLLGAMTTGHSGSAGTLHANGPESVRSRLVALVLESGLAAAAAETLPNAIERIVHLNTDRTIAYIGELP